MLVIEGITHAANRAYTSMCNMRTIFFILPRNMCFHVMNFQICAFLIRSIIVLWMVLTMSVISTTGIVTRQQREQKRSATKVGFFHNYFSFAVRSARNIDC